MVAIPVNLPLQHDITLPIRVQHVANGREQQALDYFLAEVEATIGQQVRNLFDYGAPTLASRDVLERFAKNDGLAVPVRPETETEAAVTIASLRAIYQAWQGLGCERGLGFLRFVLQMLWPNQWQIIRLWQDPALPYPVSATRFETPGAILTSRIQIVLDDEVSRIGLAELVTSVRRLVPANIVTSVYIDIPVQDNRNAVACVGDGMQVADLSPF